VIRHFDAWNVGAGDDWLHAEPNHFERAGDRIPIHVHAKGHFVVTDKPLRIRGFTSGGEPFDCIYPAFRAMRPFPYIRTGCWHELVAVEDDTHTLCLFITKPGDSTKDAGPDDGLHTLDRLNELNPPIQDLR
jgi:hypothetical protein